MFDSDSNLSRHATREARCDIVIHGSCGKTRPRRSGRLDFTVVKTKGKRGRVYLEVLVMPTLGVNLFSVGALKEEGVHFDNS